MEYQGDDNTNCDGFARFSLQKISTRIRRLGNKKTIGDYLDYSIIKISQNTEKSLENLLSLKFQCKTIS